jgi:hypothetical protein
VTPEHARIAEEAGACAVMALERVPADIRADGGVARMSDPALVRSIKEAVTIPVMAKCRIGHFVQARILRRALELIEQSPAEDLYKQLFLVLTQAGERAEIRGDRGVSWKLATAYKVAVQLGAKLGLLPGDELPWRRRVSDMFFGQEEPPTWEQALGEPGGIWTSSAWKDCTALPAEHDIAGNGAGVELAGALER